MVSNIQALSMDEPNILWNLMDTTLDNELLLIEISQAVNTAKEKSQKKIIEIKLSDDEEFFDWGCILIESYDEKFINHMKNINCIFEFVELLEQENLYNDIENYTLQADIVIDLRENFRKIRE